MSRSLSPKDFYVDPDITRAETLPLMAFWDKKFLDLELSTVFKQSWLCVPKQRFRVHHNRESTLLEILEMRGNAVRFELLNESLFLKRDFKPKGSPALRCFPNLCPHAFYPLLQSDTDETRSNVIRCQQHGLVTECDGQFKQHPAFPDPDEATRQKLSLTEYPLMEWGDFYFISRGAPVAPFEEVFGDVLTSVSHLPIESFKHIPQSEELRVVDGNWKQHAWNYMDSLHIAWLHKAPHGLQDALDMTSYRTELHAHSSLQWAYANNPDHGFEPQYLPERFRDPEHPEKRVFALWWFVFPNLTLNFYPWGLSINIYMPIPGDPEHTEFHWHHYVWDERKYADREKIWLNTQVDVEDVDAMRRVSESIKSKSEPMRKGLFGAERERGPHWFHRLVSEGLLGKAWQHNLCDILSFSCPTHPSSV